MFQKALAADGRPPLKGSIVRGLLGGLTLSVIVVVIAIWLTPAGTRLSRIASPRTWTGALAVSLSFMIGGAGAGAVFGYMAPLRRALVGWIGTGMAMASVMWGAAGFSIPFLETGESFGAGMWVASTFSAAIAVGPILGLVLLGVEKIQKKRPSRGKAA